LQISVPSGFYITWRNFKRRGRGGICAEKNPERTNSTLSAVFATTKFKRRVGKREFHPQASHRTVREALTSYGSCHSLISCHLALPMVKQIRITLIDGREDRLSCANAYFMFSCEPFQQALVNIHHCGSEASLAK